VLKWYRHVVRMDDNRWPKRIMTSPPEGRLRRGRSEVKLEMEIEIMKQMNLTSDESVDRKMWRKATENQ
jgi:hypothetical protein